MYICCNKLRLNCIITYWGLDHLQTDPLGFQFCNITILGFLIGEIDLSKYIFLSILLTKFVTCIALEFIIMNFLL